MAHPSKITKAQAIAAFKEHGGDWYDPATLSDTPIKRYEK